MLKTYVKGNNYFYFILPSLIYSFIISVYMEKKNVKVVLIRENFRTFFCKVEWNLKNKMLGESSQTNNEWSICLPLPQLLSTNNV